MVAPAKTTASAAYKALYLNCGRVRWMERALIRLIDRCPMDNANVSSTTIYNVAVSLNGTATADATTTPGPEKDGHHSHAQETDR
jgi:hypothetical protein